MALKMDRPGFSSEFARDQLAKCGWEDGKGLGREEQGIKKAIKVSGKNDKQGLGLDQSEQFVFHWWDHVFNKVASSIKVKDEDGEVKLSKDEDSGTVDKISNKRPTNANKGKELLYGRFVRSGTYNAKEEEESTNSEESSEDESKLDFSNNDTLEKVFKLSGGRTAHKAARHGHKLNGKLKRLEQQEKSSPMGTPQLSPQRSAGEDGIEEECVKKEKKRSKKKKAKRNENQGLDQVSGSSPVRTVDTTLSSPEILQKDLDVDEQCVKKKKKSKKKKRENELKENEIKENEITNEFSESCKGKRRDKQAKIEKKNSKEIKSENKETAENTAKENSPESRKEKKKNEYSQYKEDEDLKVNELEVKRDFDSKIKKLKKSKKRKHEKSEEREPEDIMIECKEQKSPPDIKKAKKSKKKSSH